MLVFDPEVPDEQRDAVTLTTWAAEAHAAHEGASIEASPLDWLGTCLQTLARLGWVTVERGLEPHEAAAGEALDQAAARMLRTQLGDGEAARRLLARLQSAGGWPARSRWVGTVTPNDDAMPVLRAMLLVLVPPDHGESIAGMGAEDARSHQFQLSSWVATLSWPMFDAVRPVLLRRLGELDQGREPR